MTFTKLKTRTSFGIVGGIQFLFFSKKTRIFSKNWPSRSWKQGRYLVLLRVSTFCLFSKQKLTCLQLREGQFLEKIRVYLKKTESGYPQQYQMTSLFSASWRSIFRENTCFFLKKNRNWIPSTTPNDVLFFSFMKLRIIILTPRLGGSIFRENRCFFEKNQKVDTPNNTKWRPFFQLYEA